MAQVDLLEIFEDCTNRLNRGQSVDECLRLYPDYAIRLRPLLEAVEIVQDIRLPQSEIREDQEIVWQMLEDQLPDNVVAFPRRRFNIRLQLLIAIVFLLLLTLGTWFFLTRPDLESKPDIIVPIIESITVMPSMTFTIQPSPTQSPDVEGSATQFVITTVETVFTSTPTATVTNTPTVTASPTITPSPSPTSTNTPTTEPEVSDDHESSDLSECDEPFDLPEVLELVSEIYPNVTVTRATQNRLEDNTMIWNVTMSDGITLEVDSECGDILSIEDSADLPISTIASGGATLLSTEQPFNFDGDEDFDDFGEEDFEGGEDYFDDEFYDEGEFGEDELYFEDDEFYDDDEFDDDFDEFDDEGEFEED